MKRKFKPGDWVKIKGKFNAPKMQVLKYVAVKGMFFALVDTETYLECVWYTNGERKSAVYHQNRLIKVIETGGLFTTSVTNPTLCLT